MTADECFLTFAMGLALDLIGHFQNHPQITPITQINKKRCQTSDTGPTFTYSLYNLGAAYLKLGRAQDAIEPLRKVIQLEPTHVYANHALGLVYVELGNKTGAMQQYYVLKQLNPNAAADLLKI